MRCMYSMHFVKSYIFIVLGSFKNPQFKKKQHFFCFSKWLFHLVPAFDLEPRKPYGSPSFEPQTNIIISQPTMIIDQNPYNPEISVKTDPTRAWEADVSMLVSTTKWLQKFGLKRNRLDMESLTKHIAFRHSDGMFIYFIICCFFLETSQWLEKIDLEWMLMTSQRILLFKAHAIFKLSQLADYFNVLL